ncbi:MAG: PEGA domain-containing protein [Archangium sp.]
MTALVLALVLSGAPKTVTVVSIPTPANVRVDDEDVGLTPQDLKLSPGKHSIIVAFEGLPSVTQVVTNPKDKSTLTFDLVAAERKRLEAALKKAKADLKRVNDRSAKSFTGDTENELMLANEAVDTAKADLAKFEAQHPPKQK